MKKLKSKQSFVAIYVSEKYEEKKNIEKDKKDFRFVFLGGIFYKWNFYQNDYEYMSPSLGSVRSLFLNLFNTHYTQQNEYEKSN